MPNTPTSGSSFVIRRPRAFARGHTPITTLGEPTADTGMAFGIVRLGAGETHHAPADLEGALLLLDGEVSFSCNGARHTAARRSLFDEDPTALHFPAGTDASVTAISDCELATLGVDSSGAFEPALFDGDSLLESEHRGKGQLGDTAYRIVRTIFDGRNRPEAALVLGEVVNFPGRWSSYPPHHHPQPEIYHYRFTEPQGYGHAELGDEVWKVRHGDTIKILDERDHAQAAAPGYGMFYIWAIRHLPDRPYTVPEFTAEHRWLLERGAPVWQPRGQ